MRLVVLDHLKMLEADSRFGCSRRAGSLPSFDLCGRARRRRTEMASDLVGVRGLGLGVDASCQACSSSNCCSFVRTADGRGRALQTSGVGGLEVLTRSLRSRELAGDKRAGSYARARARREQYAYIREHWLWILAAWTLLVSPLAVVWWFLSWELLRGVMLGAVVTGASATVWFWVVQSTGTSRLMMADQAEQWTAQSLRKLGREWRLVNRFVLSYGDIDHVALGPAGAVVVETKWSAYPWRSDDGIRRQRDAVRQVERATRQLRLWHDIKTSSVRVRPVVVLWGGGTSQWPTEQRVRHLDGVAVVAGPGLLDWVRSLETDQTADRDNTLGVWTALAAQARRREEREPEDFAVPASAGAVLTRLGGFVVAATASFLAVAHTVSRTDSLVWPALVGVGVSVTALSIGQRWGWLRVPAVGALVGSAFPTVLLAVSLVLNAVL